MHEELKKLRNRIDQIDSELIKLLAERMRVVSDIASYKKENEISIPQEKREKEVIEAAKREARQLGLNPNFVEDVIKVVIRYSHQAQQQYGLP